MNRISSAEYLESLGDDEGEAGQDSHLQDAATDEEGTEPSEAERMAQDAEPPMMRKDGTVVGMKRPRPRRALLTSRA